MGGNNENKSESGALQKLLPVGEAADQILAERHQRPRPAWGGSVARDVI